MVVLCMGRVPTCLLNVVLSRLCALTGFPTALSGGCVPPRSATLIFCKTLRWRSDDEPSSFEGGLRVLADNKSLSSGATISVGGRSYTLLGWYVIPTLLGNDQALGRSAWAILWNQQGGAQDWSVECLDRIGQPLGHVNVPESDLASGLQALGKHLEQCAPVTNWALAHQWNTHERRGSVSQTTLTRLVEAVTTGINKRLNLT